MWQRKHPEMLGSCCSAVVITVMITVCFGLLTFSFFIAAWTLVLGEGASFHNLLGRKLGNWGWKCLHILDSVRKKKWNSLDSSLRGAPQSLCTKTQSPGVSCEPRFKVFYKRAVSSNFSKHKVSLKWMSICTYPVHISSKTIYSKLFKFSKKSPQPLSHVRAFYV